MELRLQEFIQSVETISDLRNVDEFNPAFIRMEKPATNIVYMIVGSKIEPSYLGVPVNVVWVVLDPSSPYYRKALKLTDTPDPDSATTIPQPQPDLWWIEILTYNQLWDTPQYWVGNRGPQGEQGPVGPQGPAGPAGSAPPLDEIACAAKQLLSGLTPTAVILGPSAVNKGDTQQYQVEVTYPEDPCTIGSTPLVQVEDIPIVLRGSTHGVINGGNELTVLNSLAGTEQATLVAWVPGFGQYYKVEKPVTLQAAVVTGITISGPTSVYGNNSINLSVVANFSDGSSSTVTSGSSFSMDDPSKASINASGVLLAGIASSGALVVTASYTANGQTFTDTHTVNINLLLPQSLTINGSSSINENSSSQYTATVTYNSGGTANVTPNWTLSGGAPAGVSAGGLVTTNTVTANTVMTLNAEFTLNGGTANGTRNITVVNVAVLPAPYFGTGPADPSADWQGFITGLANRGNNGTRLFTFSLDVIGASTYQWYAYPKSYSEAQFQDANTMFIGGMGGAGATGPGQGPNTVAAGSDKPIEVSIDVDGTATPFYVYRSEYPNLGRSESNPNTALDLNKWNVL